MVDESGAAIDGVEILLTNSGERTSTNELGRFNFELKKSGVYRWLDLLSDMKNLKNQLKLIRI